MSLFPFRRDHDAVCEEVADLRNAHEALLRDHQALARDHEALKALCEQQHALLWTIAVPWWLRNDIERAQATGWTVVELPRAIAFDRPEGDEHSYRVELPLPDEAEEVERIKAGLRLRLRSFELRAA